MIFYDINIPSDLGYTCEKRFFHETSTYPLHWHSFIEIEFFVEGSGSHEFNNTKFPIKSGDIWLLSTYDSHQVVLDRGMKSVNISLVPDILHEKLLTQLNLVHPLHCSLNKEEIQSFLAKVDILYAEQKHSNMLADVKTISIINEMIVDIIRKSSTDTASINNQTVYEMINYIKGHYKTKVSIAELANEFSLTPNYCGYLFKKTMGISFNDYLNTLRLKNACNSLLNTDLSINEIAYNAGFNSLEYFHTTFKRFYGITPAKYRSLTPLQMSNSWKTKVTPKMWTKQKEATF